MKRRKIYQGKNHHIYQKTCDNGLLFYSTIDFLVYFTIFCTVAERMDLVVLALCPMVDHIHHVIRVEHAKILARFEQQHTHLYALEWNRARKTKGPVFRHCYGAAAKLGDKQVRAVLAYNYNNPVERKLVSRAEDYRWNFLAYAKSNHPFSSPIDKMHCGKRMRAILREVRSCRQLGHYLNYAQLDRWFKALTAEERQQLTDHIISLWNVVDYEEAAAFFPSFDAMVRAFHDNTGSEYDIKEERNDWSDTVYQDCTRVLIAEKIISSTYEIPCLDLQRKLQCQQLLLQRTSARPHQICKYLHLPIS